MSNAHTFRTFARLEDSMIRAAMPRTAAAEAQQTESSTAAARTWRDGRLVNAAPLTFTLAEITAQ